MGELTILESGGVLSLSIVYTFESNVHFTVENRSKTYNNTLTRESQIENVQYLKNIIKKQTCFALERCGA
jgi:hypothetical protein